jgi:hypothetical protein
MVCGLFLAITSVAPAPQQYNNNFNRNQFNRLQVQPLQQQNQQQYQQQNNYQTPAPFTQNKLVSNPSR